MVYRNVERSGVGVSSDDDDLVESNDDKEWSKLIIIR